MARPERVLDPEAGPLQQFAYDLVQLRKNAPGITTLQDLADRSGYSSTTPFVLPADGAWHQATFTLSAATMTAVNAPTDPFDTFVTGVTEMRILSATAPAYQGDRIAGVLGIDNIAAHAPVPEPAGVLAVGAAFGAACVFVRRRIRFG